MKSYTVAGAVKTETREWIEKSSVREKDPPIRQC